MLDLKLADVKICTLNLKINILYINRFKNISSPGSKEVNPCLISMVVPGCTVYL